MAVRKKVKQLYFSFFEKPELLAANFIMRLQGRLNLVKNIKRGSRLTKEQIRQVREYWNSFKSISPPRTSFRWRIMILPEKY